MSEREVAVYRTSRTNSIRLLHEDPKLMVKSVVNAFLTAIINPLPFPEVRNFLYRRLGVSIGSKTDFIARPDIFFPEKISVGDNCIIAGNAHLLTHEFIQGAYRTGRIDIGDNVVVGESSIILPGVSIGDNATVGAGSVVTKDVEEETVVAGNPARKIRDK